MSVDSWGLDCVLLDARGDVISPVFHYRDPRTERGVKTLFAKVPWEQVFAETGIQFLPINHLYHLAAESPERLAHAAQIIPIGDLFKSQVWALARHLDVPQPIIDKPASADLVEGQTDEGDFGVRYAVADEILNWILHGWSPTELVARGMDAEAIRLVTRRLDSTHWKRKLPTVAMLSGAAIGESYLRPVDL